MAAEALDVGLYDAVVLSAGAMHPYALWGYLRAVAGLGWGAYVWEDEAGYVGVFPVVRGRKWGIVPYVYMPPFVQQLGLFVRPGVMLGQESLAWLQRRLFWGFARRHYGAWALPAHWYLKSAKKRNLILDLSGEYEAIAKGYSKGVKSNLKAGRATEILASVRIEEADGGGTVWNLFMKETAAKVPDWTSAHSMAWVRLYAMPSTHYTMLHMVAKDAGNEQMLAAASFVCFGRRIIHLMGASTAEGYGRGAMATLLDHLIQKCAGSNIVLDFESGNLSNLAKFYKGFGATEEVYYSL